MVKCEVSVRFINARRRVICEAGMCEAQRTTGAAGVVIGCEPLKRNSPGSSPGVAAPISSIRLNRVVTDMKPAAVGLSGPTQLNSTQPEITDAGV